jgi:hypothetical protein
MPCCGKPRKDFQDKIVSLYGEKALNSIKKMLEINLERE